MIDAIRSYPTPFSDEFFGGTFLRYYERYGPGSLRETLCGELHLGRSALFGVPTALSNFVMPTQPLWPEGMSSVLDEHPAVTAAVDAAIFPHSFA